MVITTLASSPCAAILILAGGGYRAGGAVQIGGDGEAPSKLQHEWKLPRRDRQIGSQAGVISPPGPRSLYYQLLPPEAPQEENMCKSSAYSPLPCPQVHKKSDVDGYRQANSGVPVTPSKLGGKVWGPDTPIGVLE